MVYDNVCFFAWSNAFRGAHNRLLSLNHVQRSKKTHVFCCSAGGANGQGGVILNREMSPWQMMRATLLYLAQRSDAAAVSSGTVRGHTLSLSRCLLRCVCNSSVISNHTRR